MTKQEKMQELRVFAEQIRLETLGIIGSLGIWPCRRLMCPW